MSDFTCENTDKNGNRPTDSDKSKEFRQLRFSEYLVLKTLPFLNEKQAQRYNRLLALRVEDNRAAFTEDVGQAPIFPERSFH